MMQFWKQSITGSLSLKLAVMILVLIWLLALGLVGIAFTLMMERAGQAQLPTIESNLPTIGLDPATGSFDTIITVQGQGWQPGHPVMIYAVAPDDIDVTGYALAGAEVDSTGHFVAILLLPTDPALVLEEQIKIIARDPASEVTVQAFFGLVNSAVPPPETVEEPTPTVIPTSIPTTVVQPPTATVQPLIALATATADVNIRSGPGMAYDIVGLLRTGQSTEVTGLSPDGNWWQIKFSGTGGERGWVSARYVTSQDTTNIPVAQPPATPLPVVIRDWRGEYFNNPTLSGGPVLVRNDLAVSFGWGPNSPGPGVPPDRFSACWSRDLYFSAGTYRFNLFVHYQG